MAGRKSEAENKAWVSDNLYVHVQPMSTKLPRHNNRPQNRKKQGDDKDQLALAVQTAEISTYISEVPMLRILSPKINPAKHILSQ